PRHPLRRLVDVDAPVGPRVACPRGGGRAGGDRAGPAVAFRGRAGRRCGARAGPAPERRLRCGRGRGRRPRPPPGRTRGWRAWGVAAGDTGPAALASLLGVVWGGVVRALVRSGRSGW